MPEITGLLEKLNSSQQRASTTSGWILLNAGPGTGKTLVGVCRVAHGLVVQNIPPHEILALTFTNRAAGEFRERLSQLLPEGSQAVRVNTFHRLALSLLEIERGERAKILEPGRRQQLLLDLTRQYLKCRPVEAKSKRWQEKEYGNRSYPEWLAEKAGEALSRLKARNLTPSAYPGNREVASESDRLIGYLYPLYQSYLEQTGLFDLDDLVPVATETLRNSPWLARIPGVGVRLVVVDEAQDVEFARLELMLALLKASRSELNREGEVLAVGDELQRIFCPAGAGVFERLASEGPGASRLELDEEYRFGPTINAAASRIAAALGYERNVRAHRLLDDPEQRFQPLLSGRAEVRVKPGQLPVAIYAAGDQTEEAEFIAEEIDRVQALVPAVSVGVLVHTRRQLPALIEALEQRAISFQLKQPEEETGAIKAPERARSLPLTPDSKPEPALTVSLLTIHASKGLEFDLVMLPGLALNLFPSSPSDSRSALMLWLTGLTRARYLAYMSFPQKIVNRKGHYQEAGPSPFLSLLPRL
ncbi:MAG TPA: ATP-dependent helicase [Chloroflexia bacterium]|nr:ATP-dependent helicase [Chloroflexia bacterium]